MTLHLTSCVSTAPIERPMVQLHVEDLLNAVNDYYAEVRHARGYAAVMLAATKFREANGLDLDHRER